jgi:hypothetical protein
MDGSQIKSFLHRLNDSVAAAILASIFLKLSLVEIAFDESVTRWRVPSAFLPANEINLDNSLKDRVKDPGGMFSKILSHKNS